MTVRDRNTMVVRHQRAVGKGATVLDLDHYLEILQRKPGALPGATSLAQARASNAFTAEHEAFWAAARKAHGDSAGTRARVEVLLLHRHMNRADVLAGITAALTVGSTSPDVVALEARKAAERRSAGMAQMMPTQAVASSSWPSIARRACLPIPGRCRRRSTLRTRGACLTSHTHLIHTVRIVCLMKSCRPPIF